MKNTQGPGVYMLKEKYSALDRTWINAQTAGEKYASSDWQEIIKNLDSRFGKELHGLAFIDLT